MDGTLKDWEDCLKEQIQKEKDEYAVAFLKWYEDNVMTIPYGKPLIEQFKESLNK